MNPDPFRVQEQPDKRLRVGRDKHQWVEANFVAPDITDEHAILYSQTDGYIGTVLTQRNIIHFAVVALIGFFAVLGRAAFLQVAHGASYLGQSDANRIRYEHVFADRGLFYDRFQHPLVHNVPNYTVSIRPKLLPQDAQERSDLLTGIYTTYLLSSTNATLNDFLHTFETARSNTATYDKDVLVADSLSRDQAILLQIAVKDMPAVTVQAAFRREYLNEGPTGGALDDTQVYPPVKSLSHILGYMTRLHPGEYEEVKEEGYLYSDTIGRSGLEAVYEDLLRGQYGRKEIEVDAQGRFKQVLNQQAPEDGKNLLLSLDLEFQRNVESIVRSRLEERDKQAASVVVLNPNNGEILALVNVPTYDNNVFSFGINGIDSKELFENPLRPLFNRAISGEYPSGSIFKPVVAIAALEEGLVSDRTTYLSAGGVRINDFFFPDWKAGGHGATNVYKAIAESVNTYFYIVGGGYEPQNIEGLGVQRITDYGRRFGLSSPLGIDLPSEASGFLPSKEWKEEVKKERWYVGDTYHLAIGQGDLLVTPLQMAAMMASFANGGTLYQPHLLTAVLDENRNPERTIDPVVIQQSVGDAEDIHIVRQGLRQVVTVGSGRRLSTLDIDVSGKTGTAQWHSKKDPHAWFVGYAPTRQASIAFAILVEEGGDGSDIPLTIAHDILAWWSQNRSAGGVSTN